MERSKWDRALIIVSLIFAGEAIFALPYHVTRFFRPTFLEVFELSATGLSVVQSAYGFLAMAAYFFWWADSGPCRTAHAAGGLSVGHRIGRPLTSQIP